VIDERIALNDACDTPVLLSLAKRPCLCNDAPTDTDFLANIIQGVIE
jgi:hypothetical protein